MKESTSPLRVEIVDCTLRDGEQTPGLWFTLEEKVELAVALDAAGVDVLDAGFPAASAEDGEAIQEMRARGLRARIAATARAVAADIKAASDARAQELFMFLPVSDQHLATKLRKSRAEATEFIERGIACAADAGLPVSFVAEDATRADFDWLCGLVERLSRQPLARIVVCDTVGAAVPASMDTLVRRLRNSCPDDVPLMLHCHNDFGLATANSLAGVSAGARSVSCTVNGIGERAGNADLAEVVAALSVLMGAQCRVEPTTLMKLSELVDRMTGIHTSPIKPVTGCNVYSHESGVHVDGMLKDARNYEHLSSAWVGTQTKFVFGKHSGTGLLRQLCSERGVDLNDDELDELLLAVKKWATRRSKARQYAMHRSVAEFRHAVLGGVPREEVVELARAVAAGRGARRAVEGLEDVVEPRWV